MAFWEVVPPLKPAPLHWYATPEAGPPVKATVAVVQVNVAEFEAVGNGGVIFCVTLVVAVAVQLFVVLVTNKV